MITDNFGSKTKKELAALYRVSKSKLQKMLKNIPDLQKNINDRILFPDQLKKIFDVYGNPSDIG